MTLVGPDMVVIAVFLGRWAVPAVALWRLVSVMDHNPWAYAVFGVLGWFGLAIVVVGMVAGMNQPAGPARKGRSLGRHD